jgi:para-nitrobenzyl esterase
MSNTKCCKWLSRRAMIRATLAVPAVLVASAVPFRSEAEGVRGHLTGVVVQTAEGALRGLRTQTLDIFKGVRYGETTAGANRFRPPIPVRPWTGIREAIRLGSPCPQDDGIDYRPWQDPNLPGSEDCLFLNVWSPRRPGKRPVMFFMHGGAYYVGSGGAPIYDGGTLAERGDVVVVTVNHRLGIFGYMYLGGVASQFRDCANLGQRDLLEALRWVRRNISAFGGDPENVTIWGESGGGGKVNVTLAMPAAAGLYHKAIVESGSFLRVRSADVATEEALAVLRELGLSPSNVSALGLVPANRLLQAFQVILTRRAQDHDPAAGMPFSPILDPETMPSQPESRASQVLWKDVPLLVGTNEAEGAYILTMKGPMPKPTDDAALRTEIRRMFPQVDDNKAAGLIAAYREQMPSATQQQLLVSVATGLWMWRDAVRQAELRCDLGGAPVYMYQFGWKDPCFGSAFAIHAVEMPFVFDKLNLQPLWDGSDTAKERALRDPERLRFKLRDAVIAAWAGFARSGTPENAELPVWPPYSLAERATMRLNGVNTVLKDPLGSRIRAVLDA